jgi:hypothetical protein
MMDRLPPEIRANVWKFTLPQHPRLRDAAEDLEGSPSIVGWWLEREDYVDERMRV